MIRYIHGSGDSTDVDVHYVFDELPDKNECKKFSSADPSENRNMIVVKDGVVTDCYKGTVDEINNGLIDTYDKHPQEYPLIVTQRVPRIKCIKYIRAVRGILSHLSRSQYRTEVKTALKSNWNVRLDTLMNIDLETIDFDKLNNNMSDKDILKVIAFQIGQSVGLMDSVELYTKRDIADRYPILKPYLYREDNSDLEFLNIVLHVFITRLKKIKVEESSDRIVKFIDEDKTIELIHETFV